MTFAPFHHIISAVLILLWLWSDAMLPNTVYSLSPCRLCPPGLQETRRECLTLTVAVTGAASPWSPPRPRMPVEMPTQKPELPSNPSLSPLILWARVSSEHLHNNTHWHKRSPRRDVLVLGLSFICVVNIIYNYNNYHYTGQFNQTCFLLKNWVNKLPKLTMSLTLEYLRRYFSCDVKWTLKLLGFFPNGSLLNLDHSKLNSPYFQIVSQHLLFFFLLIWFRVTLTFCQVREKNFSIWIQIFFF